VGAHVQESQHPAEVGQQEQHREDEPPGDARGTRGCDCGERIGQQDRGNGEQHDIALT